MQVKPPEKGQANSAAGSDGKSDLRDRRPGERHPDPRHPGPRHPEPPPNRPPQTPPPPPVHRHPQPPVWFPSYFYDDSAADYWDWDLMGEPCTVACLSDTSVRCSSYYGECRQLGDRLICDSRVYLCP
ncbi:MAG TPA: hypothetical protein VHR45_14305 [Thermoanaerobaculia bacterium]|nr:hypothetical protein [Thermoanaerobaculia bacterium]